ncbi:MAG TPA: PIN domain-containing protein [Candidatus Binataceae bacterium]|nr:PIN domain-containing protein [Candidatus Binataceae bacterium]
MRAFFDTSALIPVFLEDHEHHERSIKAFIAADRRRDACAAHSLAEVYATMTRLPGRHRVSGEQVLLFLENIRERLSLIALTGDEYDAMIRDAAGAGIVGGTIYDALIARCALKAKADAVYTWNTKHFEQFGPAIAKRLKTP